MKPQGCTCTEVEVPELHDALAEEGMQVLDMDPDCPVHDFKKVIRLLDPRNRGESET